MISNRCPQALALVETAEGTTPLVLPAGLTVMAAMQAVLWADNETMDLCIPARYVEPRPATASRIARADLAQIRRDLEQELRRVRRQTAAAGRPG